MTYMLFLALWLSSAVAAPPGVVIDYQAPATRQYIGSPSIVILPDHSYVASHDYFGAGSTQSTSAISRVFRSTDRGKTWRQTAEMRDQFWSTLFVHRGRLYLMGTTFEYGRVVIRRSTDGGRTWSDASYLTEDNGYHTAPVPIAIHAGRIWRAMEYHPPGPWGSFEALVLSAPLKSDLLNPKSWQMSERLAYPKDAAPGKTWLEGNAVIAPNGELLDILRVDNVEKAALVRVRGRQLEFHKLVDFPGGAKKFTIRYDRKSRRYWALANPAPDVDKPARVRNKLALISSSDLVNWRVDRALIEHPDALNHGFQYVDWQFEGNDLIAAVRVAFDDENGGAHNFHDANFLTFLRVPNFRGRP
jgi:hypothetical protein